MEQAVIARSPEFSFRRLGLLLRRELALSWRSLAIAAASIAGFVIIMSLLAARSDAQGFHDQLFQPLLVIGGLVVSSLVFKEVRQVGQGVAYLTLPGSSFEKLLSKLLLTSVGFAVGVTLFYTALAAASEGLNRLILGTGHPLFDPLRLSVWELIAENLVLQSVFFLGSVWFKKLVFGKTVLAMFVYLVVFGLLVYVVQRFAFGQYFGPGISLEMAPGTFRIGPNGSLTGRLVDRLSPLLTAWKVVFWAVIAPVCWVTAWLRLRETEV